MNKVWSTIAALAAGLLTQHVFADDKADTYLGFGISAARIKGPGMAGGTRPGANLSYGMQLNRYLAIEGSALLAPIVDTAYRTADGQEVSVGGFGFSARAFVPIGDSFSLHAKLGYTFPFSCIGTSYSFSPNGSNRPGGSYGLGFDIKPPEPSVIPINARRRNGMAFVRWASWAGILLMAFLMSGCGIIPLGYP